MRTEENVRGGYVDEMRLQSAVIDWLRLPLAIAVVFQHSFGAPEHVDVDMVRLHECPLSWQSMYDFVRIAGSYIITDCAVPTFFMISGFLFFYKVKEWNMSVYGNKLKKRFWSLFVPYILWICLFVLHTEMLILGGVLLHGKPLSGMWEYIIDNGGLNMLWDSFHGEGCYTTDVFGHPAPPTGPVLAPLWFVRDLMVVVLFTPLIHWLIKRFHFIPVIFFGICYFTRLFIPVHGFSADCFFWFSLGAYFSIGGKNMVTQLYRFRYPAYVIALLAIIPLIWYNGKGNEMVHYLYYTYVVCAVISLVSIAAWLLRNGKVKLNHWLARTTFFIFLCHMFVWEYVRVYMYNVLVPEDCYPIMIIAYLIRPFVIVVLCIALYWLLERYLPRLLSVLTGGRTKMKHYI